MKTTSAIAFSILTAALSVPVLAEPASFKQLSMHSNAPSTSEAGEVRIGHTAGMDKYRAYHKRYINLGAETEIAVFEEANDSEKGHSKPVRSDRVPAL